MVVVSDEHARTIAFAEIALKQIRALRHSAEPRNYEVWYHYATGYNSELNKVINEMLARQGGLSSEDLDSVHRHYVASGRLSESLDNFGAKVVGEIDQVISMIDAALGSTSRYGQSLDTAAQGLGAAKDRDALRAIVETLVSSTRQMEQSNQALEQRLKVSKQEISELQVNLEAVRHESLTDQLTSLANRKYFDQALVRTMAEASEKNHPTTLMLIDIDHFKSFNDSYGHLTGDQVLRLVAICLKENLKSCDVAARFGGEEFAIIVPQTGLQDAKEIAERVRAAVMGKELMKRSTGESLGRVTVSIGVAGWRLRESSQLLIERADSCLYAAKRRGRNRVICESELDGESLRREVA